MRSAVGMKRVESPITCRICGLASIIAEATRDRLSSPRGTKALSGGFMMLGGALSTPEAEPEADDRLRLGGGKFGGGIPGGRINRGGGMPARTHTRN